MELTFLMALVGAAFMAVVIRHKRHERNRENKALAAHVRGVKENKEVRAFDDEYLDLWRDIPWGY